MKSVCCGTDKRVGKLGQLLTEELQALRSIYKNAKRMDNRFD